MQYRLDIRHFPNLDGKLFRKLWKNGHCWMRHFLVPVLHLGQPYPEMLPSRFFSLSQGPIERWLALVRRFSLGDFPWSFGSFSTMCSSENPLIAKYRSSALVRFSDLQRSNPWKLLNKTFFATFNSTFKIIFLIR